MAPTTGSFGKRVLPATRPGNRLQIGTHAEGAIPGTGNNCDAQLGIGGVQIEGAGEFEMGVLVQGVQDFDPVHCDRLYAAVALEPDESEGTISGSAVPMGLGTLVGFFVSRYAQPAYLMVARLVRPG